MMPEPKRLGRAVLAEPGGVLVLLKHVPGDAFPIEVRRTRSVSEAQAWLIGLHVVRSAEPARVRSMVAA